MADTIKNTIVPSDGKWYNAFTLLSAAKGSAVSVGTAISFSMLSEGELYYCIAPTEPVNDDAYVLIRSYGGVEFDAGESGIWFKAPFGEIKINLREV